MAHIPPHLLNALEKRWHRVQGDAGTAPTFDYPINSGCLHPGNHTGQAERAGRGHVVGLSFSVNAQDIYKDTALVRVLECMAGTTGLEPATSAVTVFWRNL